MALQLKYDERFSGCKAVAGNGAQVCTYPANSGVFYNVNGGDYAICTGYYLDQTDSNYIYVQITSGMYLPVDLYASNWQFTSEYVRISNYSQTEAQAVVNRIIKNNEHILCKNLLCARYANKLSESERAQVRALQNRLIARNSALQSEGLLGDVRTSAPGGYAELSPYLDSLMSNGAVGVATWVVIVIAASVIAAGTAVYFAYKSIADEAEKDVKYSDDLTRTLTSKLTDEEYQQLLNETKGIVTKARIKSSLGSYGKVLMAAGSAVGGFLLYRYLKRLDLI